MTRAIDTGSLGSSPTLHVLRRDAGVRRSAVFRIGLEGRALCGRTGPITHLELGLDERTVRVKQRVVCVTCLDLDRAALTRRDQLTIGGTA